MPKTAAERKREHRANAIARGLCRDCCLRRKRKGKATCKACAQADTARKARAREAQS